MPHRIPRSETALWVTEVNDVQCCSMNAVFSKHLGFEGAEMMSVEKSVGKFMLLSDVIINVFKCLSGVESFLLTPQPFIFLPPCHNLQLPEPAFLSLLIF